MQLSRRLRRRALAALAPVTVLASAMLAVPAATAAPVTAASTGTAPAAVARPGTISVLQPSSVTPSGVRVYHVTKRALLAGIHACRDVVFSHFSDEHGLYCADLLAQPVKGGVLVSAAVEARCQLGPTGIFPRCASAEVVFTLNSSVKKPIAGTAESCGGSVHPCKSGGGNLFLGSGHRSGSACRTLSSQFWTVVTAHSAIHLNSRESGQLKTNLASQHAIVCR